MFAFNGHPVPGPIVRGLEEMPLLEEESREDLYERFAHLADAIQPVDFFDWQDVLRLTRCAIEMDRPAKFKVHLIKLQKVMALTEVIQKQSPTGMFRGDGFEKLYGLFVKDPAGQLAAHGLHPATLTAVAFAQVAPRTEIFDKNIERNQRISKSIQQGIEARRAARDDRALRAVEIVQDREVHHLKPVDPGEVPLLPGPEGQPKQETTEPSGPPVEGSEAAGSSPPVDPTTDPQGPNTEPQG